MISFLQWGYLRVAINFSTLHKFKWQYEPRPSDEGNVEEPGDVAQHSKCDEFDVTDFANDFDAVEVSHYFGHVVDDRGDAEQSGRSSKVLKDEKQIVHFQIRCFF